MLIHLYKPGAQKEGPYSLERINSDLAAGRYSGSDYWAWHEGLPEWVPLYALDGVREHGVSALATMASAASANIATLEQAVPGKAAGAVSTTASAESQSAPDADRLPSGMPFAALEHLFLISSGLGPAASRSPVTAVILQTITGEELQTIRAQVVRDVIAECSLLEGLNGQNSTPGEVWRRMDALRPELLQRARQGAYRICVRSFRIENGDKVSVFLFYNKEKL